MKKRLLSVILTLALCLSLLPTAALAAGTERTIYPDDVDANGNIIPATNFSRKGPVLTAADTNLSGKFYIVQNDVTIDGDLTVDGSQDGGLVLCDGATLTVKGALIHTGGNAFYIYGQTLQKNSNGTGRLVIENSKGDGEAIRSTSTYAPRLGISSGKLEISSENSDQLVNNVELYSTKPMHTATLDDKTVSSAEWGRASITGNKLVIEYCDHPNAKYTPHGNTQHIKSCEQCGFNTSENSWKIATCGKDGTVGYVADSNKGHYEKCPCGNPVGNLIPHKSSYTLTDNNKKHVGGCNECGYAEGEEAYHTYNDEGKCTVCDFQPVATDSTGTLYDDVNDALAAVANGKATFATLETKAKDSADKIINSSVSFDYPNKNIELVMNGYTLQKSGKPVIEVENGTLTVTGDATLVQDGLGELAAPAIRVTGGKLIFNGKLTATGASDKYAVKVTGGELKLKAGDVLNGGVSVGGSYTSVNELLGSGLAFVEKNNTSAIVDGSGKSITKDVTVVAHEHSYDNASNTCACGKHKTMATIDGIEYDNMNTAISDWKSKGGTLTLYADAGLNAVDFKSVTATAKGLVIDLNGYRINCTSYDSTSINLNRVNLTIRDSREKTSSNGAFGPIVADSGKLTLEEGGYLQGLNIPNGSTATVTLKGGKVKALDCPKPVYTLLPDGYALMNGNITVDPTAILSSTTETYIVKNAQIDVTGHKKSGNTTFGGNTIPFALSLGTDDSEIKLMQFRWYYVDEDGTAKQLIESGDVTPVNGVYSYDVNTNGKDKAGWADLTANQTYNVICVVIGKASDAAYRWQTALTGYKLTITPASITDADVTLGEQLTYTGHEQTQSISVTNGVTYQVTGNTGTDADRYELTVTGTGNYTGTVKKTWTIQPKEVTATVEITEGPFTYTGSAIEPTVMVKVGNTVINPNEYTVVYKDNTNVGTATVTIKNNAGGNYKVSGSENFTITKAASAVTAAPTTKTLTYNGEGQELVAAGTANGGTMQYSLDGTKYSADIPKAQNAGTYTVYYKVVGDRNHEDTAAQSVTVAISKAPVTVTAKDKSTYVGSEVPALPTEPVKDTDYTVSGLFGADTLEGKVTLTYDGTPDMTKTGDTTIQISGTLANANYAVSYANGKLTVTTRPSSGGSSRPSYSVTTPSKPENGSVSLSTKNAAQGNIVTVTVRPDSGYVLEKLTVTDKNGKELTLTDKGNGKFTFVMPAGTVEIKASFTEEAKAPVFADVSEKDYYYEAVQWAQKQGITDGISESLFGPNQPCTRAQIVTFLWRAAGSPEPKSTSSFADVPAESYYAKAVAWAVENGITNGTASGTFSPDAPCDRAQSVTFLFRALGEETESGTDFSDVPAGSYYESAVAWAAENGITTGTSSTTFSPNNTCSRGQIVTFLYRSYQGK